jgi:hypothetical protein
MNRSLLILPFALLLAGAGCGPSKQAETPAATAEPSSEPAPSAAPSASSSAGPADSAAPAASASAAASAKPADPPAPPPPNVTGTLGGKEFKPKAAITMGPPYKGRVLVALADYDAACHKPVEPTEGMHSVAMQIEWKQGSVAFAADKKAKLPDPWWTVVGKDKKLKQNPFVAKGKVELASAPTEEGKSTRLTLDLTSGKDTIKGDIELQVCWKIEEEGKK